MTRPKICQGCQTRLDRCYSYIGYKNKAFHKLFRERFCPCATCIVKATCQDPKFSLLSYSGQRQAHKCKKMFDSVTEYRKYLIDNGIRETRMKRKKKGKQK